MDPAFAASDYQNLTTLWSHNLVDRPENQLTGVRLSLRMYWTGWGNNYNPLAAQTKLIGLISSAPSREFFRLRSVARLRREFP